MTAPDPHTAAAVTGRAVAQLVHTLAEPYDLAVVLDAIAETARDCFDARSVAVIVLTDWTDPTSPATMITTSTRDNITVDAVLAITGPGLSAAHTGAITMIDDIGAAESRWPEHTARAHTAHLRGTRAFAITALHRCIGAVVVHTDNSWGDRANHDGQILADLAALALSVGEPERRLATMGTALGAIVADNRTIAAAIGIAAELRALDPIAARALILEQAYARGATFTGHCRTITTTHSRNPTDPTLGGLLDPPPAPEPPRAYNS